MNIFKLLSLLFITSFLVLSCSSTMKVSSQFNTPKISSPLSGNLESLTQVADRVSLEDLAFYIANDESSLYVLVDIISSRQFQNIKEFGFTLYIDSKNSTRRSFGITYPSGIYYQLRNYPGAQQGFLEEPNWSNFPENQAIQQTAERSSTQNALLLQREGRRDPMQPFSLPLSQLRAQNILLHLEEDGRSGRISFTIPLQTRPTSQFSPDIHPGDIVDIGFEIDPVRLHDMMVHGAAPLITSETAGGTTRSEEEQKNRERVGRIMMRLGDTYEKWVTATLSGPDE